MELGLTGKVAVVTGASRGIGRAIALELAKEGCDVVVTGRDGTALAGIAQAIREHGRRVVVRAADLRQAEVPAALTEVALAEFGRLDIVVNNAGATKRGSFFELSDADFQDGFALKFYGAVRLTRAAWPELRKAGGSIVNIVGIGGHEGGADFTIGGAVNAALLNFTKAMADLGVEEGVRVNAINPGWIETDRLTSRLDAQARAQGIDGDEVRRRNLAQLGVKRFGRADEIGQLACFLASPAAAYIQGALIDIDGGATRNL